MSHSDSHSPNSSAPRSTYPPISNRLTVRGTRTSLVSTVQEVNTTRMRPTTSASRRRQLCAAVRSAVVVTCFCLQTPSDLHSAIDIHRTSISNIVNVAVVIGVKFISILRDRIHYVDHVGHKIWCIVTLSC